MKITRHVPPYRRISSRWPLLPGAVYLGATHLLSLRLDGTRGIAQRYYYGDIQSIVCRKTPTGGIIGVVLALVATSIWGVLFMLSGRPAPEAALVATLFTSPVLFNLLLNLAKGPTCRCVILTASGEDHLPGLRRLRNALKAIDEVHERVVAAQGTLSDSEAAALAPLLQARKQQQNPATKQERTNRSRIWAVALFAIAILSGAIYTIDFVYSSDQKDGVDMVLHALLMFLAPIALIVGVGAHKGAVRRYALAIPGFLIVQLPLITVGMIVAAAFDGNMEALEDFSAARPDDGLAYYVLYCDILLTSVTLILLGLLGLVSLARTRAESQYPVR